PALLRARQFASQQQVDDIAKGSLRREFFNGVAAHEDFVRPHLRDCRSPELAHDGRPSVMSSNRSATKTPASRSAAVLPRTDPRLPSTMTAACPNRTPCSSSTNRPERNALMRSREGLLLSRSASRSSAL